MMTQGVGNLQLRRLLGAESELAYSVLQNSFCGFVADAAATCGNRCSEINLLSGSPISRNVVATHIKACEMSSLYNDY